MKIVARAFSSLHRMPGIALGDKAKAFRTENVHLIDAARSRAAACSGSTALM
jgi:hypothetical protein